MKAQVIPMQQRNTNLAEASQTLVSIRNRFVEMSLTFHKPQMRCRDRKAQADAESANHAKGSLITDRLLWPAALMKAFNTIESEGRDYLKSRSVRLGDKHLHPVGPAFFKTVDHIEKNIFVRRDQLKTEMLNNYAEVLAEASQSQGMRFDPSVYPDVYSIGSYFGQHLDIYPVGAIEQGMFDQLEADIVSDVKKRVADTTAAGIKDAMADPLSRLLNHMMSLYQKISGEKTRIHASLMANLEEMATLFPELNVMQIPELNAIAARIKNNLVCPPEMIRDRKASKRIDVAEASREIMGSLGMDPKEVAGLEDATERRQAAKAAALDILEQMNMFK